MNQLDMLRVAAVTPSIRLADAAHNAKEIVRCAKEADAGGAGVILFPELCITGYTCGDLFYQEHLYRAQLTGLEYILRETEAVAAALIIGCYIRIDNHFYNCAVLAQNGQIIGAVPKMFLPGTKEFYEARWFSSGAVIADDVRLLYFMGADIPFGNLIFRDLNSDVAFGIEICEDLWTPISPGSFLTLNGAHIIFNPSASNEVVGKPDYRRNLVLQASAKTVCAYVYASSGVSESTTDLVFSGHNLITENGILLAESELFQRSSTITYGDIDVQRLKFERSQVQTLADCADHYGNRSEYEVIDIYPLRMLTDADSLLRKYEKTPFIPAHPQTVDARCHEIFSIQAAGLARRLEHTDSRKAVIGISGGLDSTLALLVCAETFRLLGKDASDILAITMPGFGTTDETYTNALSIMDLLGVEIREIPIRDAVLQHFSDIGHDPAVHDVTYENAQARERMQILMDLANKEGGLVIGTGDLSEVALGWSTYNGDHMSMYGVNSSVPKTLIRFVITWVMENRLSGPHEDATYSKNNAQLRATLQRILDTPISPELLPPDKDGKIAQKTEDKVGPYILHDFFLYYTIRFGMHPQKLLYIAKQTFQDEYHADTVARWLRTFYQRFFSQQFKRSCMPDGPKVGTVSLSPRGDWRMPSDAYVRCWLESLDLLD